MLPGSPKKANDLFYDFWVPKSRDVLFWCWCRCWSPDASELSFLSFPISLHIRKGISSVCLPTTRSHSQNYFLIQTKKIQHLQYPPHKSYGITHLPSLIITNLTFDFILTRLILKPLSYRPDPTTLERFDYPSPYQLPFINKKTETNIPAPHGTQRMFHILPFRPLHARSLSCLPLVSLLEDLDLPRLASCSLSRSVSEDPDPISSFPHFKCMLCMLRTYQQTTSQLRPHERVKHIILPSHLPSSHFALSSLN